MHFHGSAPGILKIGTCICLLAKRGLSTGVEMKAEASVTGEVSNAALKQCVEASFGEFRSLESLHVHRPHSFIRVLVRHQSLKQFPGHRRGLRQRKFQILVGGDAGWQAVGLSGKFPSNVAWAKEARHDDN